MATLQHTLVKALCQYQSLMTRPVFTAACNIMMGKRFPPKESEKKKAQPKVPQVTAELKSSPSVQFPELPIILVKATYNNTLVYLTDHKGIMATWTSAGIEGFKNAKRGTNYAGKIAGEALAKRAEDLGVSRVRVKVKGMGPGRLEAVKGLVAGGLDIVSVTDVTPIPHNGPKPKKQRRL